MKSIVEGKEIGGLCKKDVKKLYINIKFKN